MQQILLGQSIVELALRQITFKDDEHKLEPKAAQLLTLLIQHQGAIVSRERILAEVFPGQYVTDGAINRLMADLRKALHRDPTLKNCIRTVPKSGYQLQAPVSPLPSQAYAAPPSPPISAGTTPRYRTWRFACALIVLLAMVAQASYLLLAERHCQPNSYWGIGGPNSRDYRVCEDADQGAPAPSVLIEGNGASGFIALTRYQWDESYRARRVRFTLQLRVEQRTALLGLFLRADKQGHAKELAFVNSSMQGDTVSESNGWVERQLELDIPVETDSLAFGVYLQGAGAAWIDNPVVELVDDASLTAHR